MTTYVIDTRKYEIDLMELLVRRLRQTGCAYAIADGPDGVGVTIADEAARLPLAEALTMLLCRDLQHFELAAYIDTLPLALHEKRRALKDAVRFARANERLQAVREGLTAYLARHRRLNLEGYLLFRMPQCLSLWREGADRAAHELGLARECRELMDALNEYLDRRQPLAGELTMCINPDGSCTLTDERNAGIEYVDCSDEGIVSLLVGMAPTRLTVYDLSDGASARLTDALCRAFGGRVRVFR